MHQIYQIILKNKFQIPLIKQINLDSKCDNNPTKLSRVSKKQESKIVPPSTACTLIVYMELVGNFRVNVSTSENNEWMWTRTPSRDLGLGIGCMWCTIWYTIYYDI